ncbi:flagellar export protein FliJ [Heliobacterium chlorum]|uniref:Flagellar FliJ protein n=1 Tax=Heliobacterium chlorum TaxID=2698 RepID=A0ABR7T1A7_HELCL|nr:flagellar export protein FliJ [Heliobacterium chlorum]MBC9783416.1 flagellar export protein FliJ [Heliobacterium chlorum]
MKPFRFKLQAALSLKLRQEDILKGDLQRQQKVIEGLEYELRETQKKMAEAIENIRPTPGAVFDVEARLFFNQFWLKLKSLESCQISEIESERDTLAKIRQQLMETMRERKILEKLREKHLADYQREILREEQKVLDELALSRYIRNENTQG